MTKKEVSEVQQEATAPAADDVTTETTEATEATETDTEESADEAEETKVLTAQAHILYESKQYRPGDILPANNEIMVGAWLAAGTAAWVAEKPAAVIAKPVTAEPGVPGDAIAPETEENLIGKVPRTAGRSSRK